MRTVWRLLATIAAGFLLTVLMVGLSPGYGLTERALDPRRGAGGQAPVTPWWISREFQRPVVELAAERAAPTIIATAAGLALVWGSALLLGAASLRVPSPWLDRGISASGLLLQCLPAGVIALAALVAGLRGVTALSLALAASLGPRVWQVSRGILHRASRAPSLVLARAQGFGPWRIIFRRVLPLALPELSGLASTSAGLALSLTIPLETVLDVPGLGQLAWQAALARDLPLLAQLMTLITALVALSGAWAQRASE